MSAEGSTTSLGDLGERAIFRDMLRPRYGGVESFGDDCAPFGRDLVITTDSCPTPLVAELGHEDPYYAGWLLATINLSDLAAAGAEPLGLMVNYTLPSSTSVNTLEHLMKGVDDCAASHGTTVLGGDLRDGPEHLTATAIGRVHRRVLGRHTGRLGRRGALPGDRLLLVGDPGYLWGAALLHHGWAHLDGDVALAGKVVNMARQPVAQLRAGRILADRGLSRAALDVSDGLYASVALLCEANGGLGALMRPEMDLDPVLDRICDEAKVSTFQLGQTWGDWCLLVAVRERDAGRALKELGRAGIRARDVGGLDTGAGLRVGTEQDSASWAGVDQERFSSSSWDGSGIDAQIRRMRDLSSDGCDPVG